MVLDPSPPRPLVPVVLSHDSAIHRWPRARLVLPTLLQGNTVTAYRTIVADPPWTPDLGGTWGARVDKGRPQRFYDTMSLDEIRALVIPADTQAHLYLWCVSQHVDWGFDVARAWGFEPVTLLTWCKPGFRCNTEHVVVGRKGSRHGNPFGSGGRAEQATDGTWFAWPTGRHSEKPDAFFDLVERLSPGPYLEMFSRRARFGWDVWGDESLGHVEIGAST